MGRIIAIDYGSKRSGIATTDPLRLIATPLKGLPTHQVFDFLTEYFAKEQVDQVIVGWPTQLDGSDTNNTPLVQAFLNRFRKLFPDMRVFLQDERNTSKQAMVSMIQSGVSKKGRRDKLAVDKVSAVIILQSYMDFIS